MKSRFPVHIVGAVALLILLIFLLAKSIKPQFPVAVDLRPSPIPSETSMKIFTPILEEKYNLIASRYVLNDLLVRAQLLRNEAGYCFNDVDLLWNTWKNFFGIQGGFTGWAWFLQPPQAPEDRFLSERLQTELFRLESAAKRNRDEAGVLADDMRRAEDRWLKIRDFLLLEEAGGQGPLPYARPALTEFRSLLSQLAGRINALEEAVRTRQEEYDALYPRFESMLQRRVKGTMFLSIPWHWQYMLGDRPRTSLQYDFEKRYSEELDHARGRLVPPAPSAPASPKPTLRQNRSLFQPLRRPIRNEKRGPNRMSDRLP